MTPQTKSLEQVRMLAGAELSLKSRLGYVSLLLVSAAMTALIVALWLTEPALPARTQWAFGAMCLIGASWMALALWVLRARRPLFARDRVVAGGMAVAFTALFTLAAALAAATHPQAGGAAWLATLQGFVLLVVAVVGWQNARRRQADLLNRRAALERG